MEWVLPVAFVCLWCEIVNAQCPVSCACSYRSIDCSDALLTDVPHDQLPGNKTVLQLSSNKIISLYNSSFPPELSSLDKLVLRNNSIRYIDENTFRNLLFLSVLDLSGNDIGFIQPEVFSGITSLVSLNLTNNPDLKLPENGYNLPELSKLELEECRMKKIPANFFKNMNNLEYLYLSRNELSFIEPTNFKHLRKLRELDLSDNWFKVFQRDLLELHSSTKLKIFKNPWICDCNFIPALDFFEHRGNNKPMICKSPKQLRGLEANKSAINELLDCKATSTTTTTTTTTDAYYDVAPDLDWYDYDNEQDFSHEKLAHLILPDLEDSDVILSSSSPLVSQSADENGVNPSAGDEYDASWFDENQWWMYCAAVLLLAIVFVAIFNKQVNENRRKNLLTNVHCNDDV